MYFGWLLVGDAAVVGLLEVAYFWSPSFDDSWAGSVPSTYEPFSDFGDAFSDGLGEFSRGKKPPGW